MKHISVLIFAFFFFIASNIFTLPFDMILTGDPVLDDLQFLSIESGNSFLSFSPPLSPHELHIFLDSIDESSLSQPASEAYYRVLKRLSPGSPLSFSTKNFAGFLNINSTLEGKVRLNEDISWQSEYLSVAPLISIPIRLHFSEYVQLYIEPHISVKPDTINNNIFPLGEGINYWPVRSFAAVGGSFWNFQIGRDNILWGTSHSGSLTFSNESSFYDFARLSFFIKYIKYSMMVSQLPLYLNSDLFLSPGDISYPEDWEKSLTKTMQRYYYLHRLDVNLFDKVSIGFMEGVMAGNSPIEIRYLNPLIIFHSLFSWRDYEKWGDEERTMNGSLFSIEVNWNIIKSLAFYGQFVMNQFALKTELDYDSNQPPNALGYLAGLHYTHTFNTWASIFYLEFIYTDPYLSINTSPFSSFIIHDWDYKYIGYQRDTIALSFGTDFFKKDTLKFSGSFSWISSGQHNKDGLKWDWQMTPAARNEKTPSGTAENKLKLTFGSLWKPYSFLALKANVSGIVSLNNGNISANNQVGAQGSLSVNFHY